LSKKRTVAERRTTKDRRAVSRSGRRETDPKAEEREFRIQQQYELLRARRRAGVAKPPRS
jgi:hypothetical protein